MQKQRHYSREDVVAHYDQRRFGGAGGAYVNERELKICLGLLGDLPRKARLLDLPVGTGRLAERLLAAGFEKLLGADYSAQMLDAAARRCGPGLQLTRQDAMATSFVDGAFDSVITLRFSFHYENFVGLASEAARLLRPGGLWVFDTLRWSPRALPIRLQRFVGGQVFVRSDAQVMEALARFGLTISAREALLLLPSMIYRGLPGPLIPALDRVEQRLPVGWRTKVIWAARKG
jgi:SAM-dependent methyltransferase